MAFYDLRGWIEQLEKEGELARIKTEVDWDLEIGGIARENMDLNGPALLFENVKGHENTIGKKLFTCSLSTFSRIAMMLGLPKDTSYKDLIQNWRNRIKNFVDPVIVDGGPCKENILRGDDVDLYQFPTPRWQKLDGGRYIGTFHSVVTRDPESVFEKS